MSNYYIYNGSVYSEEELQHHGVKGMRWGHRKAANEYSAYRSAKKERRQAQKDYKKTAYAFGIKGIQKNLQAEKRFQESEIKELHSKAAYNAAKSRNSEKAEYKTYKKAMSKVGIRGSAADKNSQGKATRIYNTVAAKKGKEYADKIERRVQNESIATLVATGTMVLGVNAIALMLNNRR